MSEKGIAVRGCVALLVIIQVFHTLADITIFRGRESGTYWYNTRKLLCASEEDGSGLIWNTNLIWQYSSYAFTDRANNMGFYNLPAYRGSEIDCSLQSYQTCMSNWELSKWSLTDSVMKPMGPVFDSRWEDFKEFNNFGSFTEYRLTYRLPKAGSIPISIRAAKDAHILFCNTDQYKSDFCYWVIIGGWQNSLSVIRKCASGVPQTYPDSSSECAEKKSEYRHEPLSTTEWRSFVLSWNETTRNITVYDENNMILTFADQGSKPKDPSDTYSVFVKSTVPMLFKLHTYSFLYTTDPEDIVKSPEFFIDTPYICVQMMIGLCAECQIEIVLKDTKGTKDDISMMTVSGSSAPTIYGLPMWQSIKINKTIEIDSVAGIRMALIPRLEKESERPFWAIANVRKCPPVGTIRFGVMMATQDYERTYFWPNVTCQKISYDKSEVVSAIGDVTLNVELEGLNCTQGMIGPHCAIDCYDHFGSSAVDCRQTVICGKSGCTCSPGFLGNKCDTSCRDNRYGHDCNGKCGLCLGRSCNFISGVCRRGCDNSNRFYIPPFCKTDIDTLPKPHIDFVNVTSVRVSLEAKDEYKEIKSSYTFIIRNETQPEIIGESNNIYANTTSLEKTIDGLKPGTVYWIKGTLYVGHDHTKISGNWETFTTICSATTDFQVEAGETSFTLKKRYAAIESFPCPANWYDVNVHEVDTGAQLQIEHMNDFPYEFPNLTSYTLYKITIGKENETYYSQEVRTLEAAPTEVRGLQRTVLNAKGVTLKWSPPEKINGILKNYEVTLKIQAYKGCQYLKQSSPITEDEIRTTSATDITFTDLHPYANYLAIVIACTSKCGPGESTDFITDAAETPTAVLHNLRLEDNTLLWNDPEDCTTVTGPIPITRLIISGVSDVVESFREVRQTSGKSFKLSNTKAPMYGAEQYKAQVFAIRNYGAPHNTSACAEHVFTTPPKAPPPVTNLERVEIDQQAKTVTLRWQEPLPPINGEIQQYTIAFCNKGCQILPTKVLPDESCQFWSNYICATVGLPKRVFSRIVVYAHNKDVTDVGEISEIPDVRDETKPEAPQNFTITPLAGGVLELKWSHPWKTGGHLGKFVISVQMTKSTLRRVARSVRETMTYDYPITNYTPEYNERLYLLPSSSYNVSVHAVTNQGLAGDRKMIAVETPSSVSLDGELTFKVYDMRSMIMLHLPTVVNDTANTVMHIVVKGPMPCEHHTKLSKDLAEQAGVKYFEVAWKAATISPKEYAEKVFYVGDNKIYGGATNCPLMPQDAYEVIVVLQTGDGSMNEHVIVAKTSSILIGEVPRRHDEVWLIPIMILLIVAVLALYFYRRRSKNIFKQASLYDEMPLSNNTDSFETKCITPNSPKIKEDPPPPSPSDKDSLSRMSTPENTPITAVDIDPENRTSLAKVKDFEDYVRQAIACGLLDKQYETFPRGQTKPWDYGKLPQNKSKNRYANLIAYDETRVILEKLPDDAYSDYINANYIKGYKKDKRYIATQGPKQNTVIDFWRMIWQEEVLVICMLANVIESGKTKCEQYWPDIGKKKKYGDVVVLNAKHNVFADYTFRTLHVTCGDMTRKIEHLHYTAWPDHGVPLYTHSVVTYLKKLLATSCGNGPVVVHCSAGVGRTGTIVLCDICLRRAAAEGVVDVFAETEAIRNQRANMVDNKQQYLLAHLALVECLLSLPTALPCNDNLPAKIKDLKKQLAMQRQRLQDTAWQDEALRPPTTQTSLSARNRAKNRYPELISDKVSRIYIKRYPVTDEDSDYVSGVYVDGVKLQNQYLAAQLPLPSTCNDFWRMVAELKVELIVMLQQPDLQDSTCCAIAPKTGEFKPTPYINVITKDITEMEHYTSQKLTLIDNSEKPAREQPVTILSSTDWKSGRNQEPPPVISLVTLWQAAERISRGDGPMVTLCHDGVTGCGLYLALSFLLERMAVERECDVCLAIRAIRRSRPDFVQSLEHMEYLYDAAVTYLEYFETYANFS